MYYIKEVYGMCFYTDRIRKAYEGSYWNHIKKENL